MIQCLQESSSALTCPSPPQELAGYTGGDVSFLKEDFELQLNKQLVLDSVSVRGALPPQLLS